MSLDRRKIKSDRTCHAVHVLTSPNCHERLDFGGRAGGTETSWLDISVCLVVGSFPGAGALPGGILRGIGGGDRRVPLPGHLRRIGSGASLSSAR